MPKNSPKVNVYEISIQARTLDKTIIPQIVIDKEPALVVAHVAVLRAGESKKGSKRLFAFQQNRAMPTAEAPWYGWVGDSDWTVPQEDYAIAAWLPLDALPKPKQTELKKSEWGLLAVVAMENRLRLRDVQVDVSMTDEAHEKMARDLGLPEVVFMADLDKQTLAGLFEKRGIYQAFL
jgi:hypothetical protein